MMAKKTVTAALIVIGDEILSGRTKDQNIGYVAGYLTAIGIRLSEVRVVADDEDHIVEAVNALRRQFTYVFTTGGIGPTHDDITANSIAKAFGVGIDVDDRALALMKTRYREDQLTPARLRMARIPDGAELVENSVSITPGFMLENVIVLAGVPSIMQVMLDAVSPALERGAVMLTKTIRVEKPEGDVATGLSAVQEAYADVSMGSYPFFENGLLGTHLVVRATEPARLDEAVAALQARLEADGLGAVSRLVEEAS